jgi:hypothetical protein
LKEIHEKAILVPKKLKSEGKGSRAVTRHLGNGSCNKRFPEGPLE